MVHPFALNHVSPTPTSTRGGTCELGDSFHLLAQRRPATLGVLGGRVFEEIARRHARRLVARGDLPRDTVVGRYSYAFWSSAGVAKALEATSARVFDVAAMLE
jgi:hypothetical protein